MNLFRRIDALLLARVFQPVVDLSQRQPIWWVQQSAVPAALLLSRSAVLVAWIGSCDLWRMIALWLTLTTFAMLLTVWWASSALGQPFTLPVLDNLASVVQVALLFFAACRPPKPRVPRTAPDRLSLGGA